ncbi:MAG: ubiquitin-like domain-containing protein [Anaerolineae bacterium]|nr:ubiquitin-like domain-containing protein [Anaerolineae bacterium]
MSRSPQPHPTRAASWERYLPLGILAILGGMVLIALLAGAILLLPGSRAEKNITVLVNGQSQTAVTRARTVANLLAERGIILFEGDTVSPALTSRLTDNLTVRITKARSVTLTIDGQSQIYRTPLTNPAAILESAGITVSPLDILLVDGTRTDPTQLANWPVPVTRISLRRTMPIQVADDDRTVTIETTSLTVGEALFDAGITLYLADQVTPDLDTPVMPDMTITITRGQPLSIIADGTVVETRVRGLTVADALAESGLALVGQDYTIPAENTPLIPGIRIRVIRVTEDVITEERTQDYETIFQADPALEIDQRQTAQTGQAGLIQTSIRVRYENGVEVSREPIAEIVAQEVRNQVITYGTNIVLRSIDTPDGPRQYWRRIRMYATSYHPAALGGDARTAIGETLRKGIVASNPDIVPYRSEVYVPGYGIGKMADTGPLYRPLFIDLGYDDDNFVSWSRWVDVYLLTPVPDSIPYLLPQAS